MITKEKSLLKSLAHGLHGYLIYYSRLGFSSYYSEYIFYEPIVRIAKNLSWRVVNESVLKAKGKKTSGRDRRFDFKFVLDGNTQIILEIKWQKRGSKGKIDVNREIEKFQDADISSCFILVLGNKESKKFILNDETDFECIEDLNYKSWHTTHSVKVYRFIGK